MSKKEKYIYSDDASNDMLISLLITSDGRGPKEQKLAFKKLLERYAEDKEAVELALKKLENRI